MMPTPGPGWYLLALGLCLAGFILLALATERQGALLLGQMPAPCARMGLRLAGATSLALAWLVCARHWQPGFGTVLWLGLLTVTSAALVAAIPYLPRRSQPRNTQPRKTPP